MDTLVGNGTMWATATFFPTVRCNKSQGMKQLMAGAGVAGTNNEYKQSEYGPL